MAINSIGIAGAGIMGSGLAQLVSSKGYKALVYDIQEEYTEKALVGIKKNLSKMLEKQKIDQDEVEKILSNICMTTDLHVFSGVDVVIEAVVENIDIKKDLFVKLDEICPPETILCTNTSSMSITAIAAATKRSERVAGMHFFNPATAMKLVEIIRGYETSDETVSFVRELALNLGKTPIEVKKDTPGFVVNRILFPHFLEAIHIYEEGIASKEDIDTAVKLGLNYPMGPFELMDFGGVDTLLNVTEYFFEETKDVKWNLPQTARNILRAGRLGKKCGSGWYDYTNKKTC